MQSASSRDQTEPDISRFYRETRGLSTAIAAPLSAEDQCVQSMPDASPAKWHLAHTTWFFERMLLADLPGYEAFDPRYDAIFNSYYLGLGTPFTRANRGLLTRPSLDDVMVYRRHVDEAIENILDRADTKQRDVILLGLNHEQQHQELMLTDIKHALACSPLLPAYRPSAPSPLENVPPQEWITHSGGVVPIGHNGENFAFDNESSRHEVLLRPFRLSSRLVTCGEYRDFIADGGYTRPDFWLSDGWALAQRENWNAPLYWLPDGRIFSLQGERALNSGEPVCHVSFYEAAAYAAWAGKRLPTEFEWEAIASREAASGHFLDLDVLRPRGGNEMFGDAWIWTRSSYDPYPGYRPFDGALSEYNGKFMVGQQVLRGGSCVTPPGHVRASYRNFFPPAARWQFSGIRLAEDV